MTKKLIIFVSLCMLITTALGLLFVGSKNFSQDELDTIYVVSDWSRMLHVIYNFEGNMWLYYILVHFWQFFGNSETILRLLSVIFAVLTIPFVYLLGRLLFNEKIAQLSTLFISTNILVIISAQFARGYTLVLFLTTLSSYLFAKYISTRSEKYIFILSIINVLAVYSHLYAVFIIVAQLLTLFFILDKKIFFKNFLPFYSFTGLLLVPLIIVPSIHSGQLDWLPRPTIVNLIGTFFLFSNDFLPIGFIYGLLLLWFVLRGNFQKKWNYVYPLLCIILPITTAFVFSLLIKPIYQSPYMIISFVPFAYVISLAIYSIHKILFRNIIIFGIFLLISIRLFGWYTENPNLWLTIRNYREDWKKVAIFLSTHMQRDSAVLFSPPSGQYRVNYYIKQQNYPPLPHEEAVQTPFLKIGKNTYEVDVRKLQVLPQKYSNLWYVRFKAIDKHAGEASTFINNFLLKNYDVRTKTYFKDFEVIEYTR